MSKQKGLKRLINDYMKGCRMKKKDILERFERFIIEELPSIREKQVTKHK